MSVNNYIGYAGVARILGISRQRAYQLQAEGKMPPAEAMVDGRPVWSPSSIESFKQHRASHCEKCGHAIDS